jgi:hypothetical protein
MAALTCHGYVRLLALAGAAAMSVPASAQSLEELLAPRPVDCAAAAIRLSAGFPADEVRCGGKQVEARGDGFILSVTAYVPGMFWYQPVRAYFKDSPAFHEMSDWSDEEDSRNRFDYATFRGDLVGDETDVLSCVAMTRHSSPYMGRGFLAQHLIVGIYCDGNYGEAPVPTARIDEVIGAIEFEFE